MQLYSEEPYAQIRQAGGLWSLVEEIYPYFGGTPSGSSWYFNKMDIKQRLGFSYPTRKR